MLDVNLHCLIHTLKTFVLIVLLLKTQKEEKEEELDTTSKKKKRKADEGIPLLIMLNQIMV